MSKQKPSRELSSALYYTYWDRVIFLSAREGRTDIMNFALKKVHPEKRHLLINVILIGSCEGGHVDIINKAIIDGATNFNLALKHSALGGHLEIVKVMLLQYNASDIEEALSYACLHGQHQVFQYLMQQYISHINPSNLSFLMIQSIRSNSIPIFKQLLQMMVGDITNCNINHNKRSQCIANSNLNIPLEYAAYHQNIPIITMLIKHGAYIWNEQVCNILENNKTLIIQLYQSGVPRDVFIENDKHRFDSILTTFEKWRRQVFFILVNQTYLPNVLADIIISY